MLDESSARPCVRANLQERQDVTQGLGRICPEHDGDVKGGDPPAPRLARAGESRRLASWAGKCATLGTLALVTGACVVRHDDTPAAASTTIEFDESTNIGFACSPGAAFAWTVTARETGDTGTAGCEQPIDFVSYATGTTYTFDVVGTLNGKTCWQGSCAVPARAVPTTLADCSGQIAHLCNE